MSASSDTANMALFCDFENVALGVRDAKYAKFDINKVLERLLLKGSIVVKKAYCDWERYKEIKSDIHEAWVEFIFYDDRVRERPGHRQQKKKPQAKPAASGEAAPKDGEDKTEKALELVMQTVEALIDERGADEKIWGSMVKQALKRRNPGFNESYYGFSSFSKLLDEAESRKMLQLERDEKSGGYIVKSVAH